MSADDGKVLTVSALTAKIKAAIRNGVDTPCWVEGEISGFRGDVNSSGHLYFSLKDGSAVISAAIFSQNRSGIANGLSLADGKKVRAYGDVSVYEPRGIYTFVISKIEEAGIGDALARLEALKKKLSGEGLFDLDRKLKIPFLPRHIGIISSPTGAVIHDILTVSLRRYPNLHITLAPAAVQGERAAESVVRALNFFNQDPSSSCIEPVDVIIIARGGGSFEDLMPFNDERLARAVVNSRIPVISSVGHQTDTTLCDYAASVRAATPSEAAERAVPEKAALVARLDKLSRSLVSCATRRTSLCRAELNALSGSVFFRQPQRMTEALSMRVDAAETTLNSLRKIRVSEVRNQISCVEPRMRGALQLALQNAQRRCADAEREMRRALDSSLESKKRALERCQGMLEAYSPLATLRRGFTITFGENGEVVRSAQDAAKCRTLTTRFADGQVASSLN